jgi:hypothetical protein
MGENRTGAEHHVLAAEQEVNRSTRTLRILPHPTSAKARLRRARASVTLFPIGGEGRVRGISDLI